MWLGGLGCPSHSKTTPPHWSAYPCAPHGGGRWFQWVVEWQTVPSASQAGHDVGPGRVSRHSYTNVISKPATMRRGEYKSRKWELHLKLREGQLKTTLCVCVCVCIYIYMYKHSFYQNLMGNANQKTIIDTHTKKKKQPNTTLKMVIKPHWTKQETRKKYLEVDWLGFHIFRKIKEQGNKYRVQS